MSYSQNDEEKWIVDFFAGRVGRFIDIGAYDGKTFSNVRALLDLGWSGILIEPAPSVIPALCMNVECYGDRANVMTCAVGSTDGNVRFFDEAGAVATTSEQHMKKWSGKTTFRECEVLQVTPNTLLDLVGDKGIDFINIDVEGANIDIARLMPWHRLMPTLSIIVIEHDRHQAEIIEMLSGFGFTKLHENRENLILVR